MTVRYDMHSSGHVESFLFEETDMKSYIKELVQIQQSNCTNTSGNKSKE